MLEVRFSENFNGKLFCDRFCDVRINNQFYYEGQFCNIFCKSINMGVAKIISVRPFRYSKITDSLSYQVVGKPAPYLAHIMKCMNGNKVEEDLMLTQIIFEYTNRDYEIQSELLNDWWHTKKPADA